MRLLPLSAPVTLAVLLSAVVPAQSTYADVTQPPDIFFGEAVSLLGDVDGDGHAEFTVSSRNDVSVYSGSTLRLLTTLPNVVGGARAGDIDGDGIQDFLVRGVPFNQTFQVIRGGAWTPLSTITVSGAAGFYALDDVDGDGVDDFGVSTTGFNGSVIVFSGATGTQLFSAAGDSSCPIGDVSGDGITDFVMRDRFSARVYSIGPAAPVGTATTLLTVPKRFSARAGISACEGVGDFDGDNVPDFALGESYATSPSGWSRAGAVTIYSGAGGAILQTIFGTAPGQRLGRHIERLGDLNGDGVDEALIATTELRAVVVDLVAGTERASIDGLGHQFVVLGDSGFDVTGDGVPDGIIGAPQPVTGNPGFARIVSGETLDFRTDEVHMPAASGGSVTMSVDVGAANAGALYLVLGTFAGTTPGTTVGSISVPFNRDFYFDYLVTQPNTLISGSLGALDPNGRAQALLTVGAGTIPAAMVGMTADHGCVWVAPASQVLSTNSMPLTITP